MHENDSKIDFHRRPAQTIKATAANLCRKTIGKNNPLDF